MGIGFLLGCLVVMLMACGAASTAGSNQRTPEVTRGEQAYNQTCAQCHGPQGRGTNQGPPLVHKIYEPSHHADASFLLAVRRGVVQHHWPFGNMPPQPNVSDDEVKAITAYVRWLQRQVGIQ